VNAAQARHDEMPVFMDEDDDGKGNDGGCDVKNHPERIRT
jgi:hypothetical protein